MKTRFESLHRLSNIFEKFRDNFTIEIQKNLMSVKKRIIENFKKNEMKYLLHVNLIFRFQKICVIYCSKFTTYEKLNRVKNIFRNCFSI